MNNKHPITRINEILMNLQNTSLEDISTALDCYKGQDHLDNGSLHLQPVEIDGMRYNATYNPQIAATLNARYRELTGNDHPTFIQEQQRALDLLLSNEQELIDNNSYFPSQIDTLKGLQENLINSQNVEVITSSQEHILGRANYIIQNINEASISDIEKLLNYYNGDTVIMNGMAYHPFNDPEIAARLDTRYFVLTGLHHPVYLEQAPKVIDDLMQNREMLVQTGAYTPAYFAQLEHINNQLTSIKKPMESSTKEELREIKEQLEQVREQQPSQQPNYPNYDEYRESLRNIYLEDKENDTVVHSQFNVTHGENPQCEHTLERINHDGRNIVSQRTFDYNDDFRQQVLAPSVIDYAQCSPIKSSEVKGNSNQIGEESQTVDYQAVSENNNVLSVNNIEPQYATEISNAIQQIEPVAYQQQQSQQMAIQQEMGGQQLGLALGSHPSMNGFASTIILSVVVGIICLLLIFLGVWISI